MVLLYILCLRKKNEIHVHILLLIHDIFTAVTLIAENIISGRAVDSQESAPPISGSSLSSVSQLIASIVCLGMSFTTAATANYSLDT